MPRLTPRPASKSPSSPAQSRNPRGGVSENTYPSASAQNLASCSGSVQGRMTSWKRGNPGHVLRVQRGKRRTADVRAPGDRGGGTSGPIKLQGIGLRTRHTVRLGLRLCSPVITCHLGTGLRGHIDTDVRTVCVWARTLSPRSYQGKGALRAVIGAQGCGLPRTLRSSQSFFRAAFAGLHSRLLFRLPADGARARLLRREARARAVEGGNRAEHGREGSDGQGSGARPS